MLDKEKTNYLRQKLSNMKDTALPDTSTDASPAPNAVAIPKNVLFNFFVAVIKYLAFYGTQYIIISKFVNPLLVLNFFESGVVFLCLLAVIPKYK